MDYTKNYNNKVAVVLDKPLPTDEIKPEVWYIKNSTDHHFVYRTSVISSKLISYKLTELGFEYTTKNNIYICDFTPTIKVVSKEYFEQLRESSLRNQSF
jgi:hypothetical protein|tara:strand:+ start:2972 stop:3268 length:297 start_codon:yes stop_codon:yes gene_type:complete